MKSTVTLIHSHFNVHKTLISTIQKPNWFEWLFLFRRTKRVDYLGHKTVWDYYPTMKRIKSKELLIELEAIEKKGTVIRGASKNKRVAALTFKS